MLIRDAVETDLPAIVAIYNAAIPGGMATADIEPVSVESRSFWFHEHTSNYHPIWVMEVEPALGKSAPIQTYDLRLTTYDLTEVDQALGKPEPRIAGWLSFQSFYGRPAYQATAEVSIYVDPAYQRCGIGRQLLTRAIHHSPKMKTLVGLIFAHNQPSLQLFESLDFQRWGYMPKVAELHGVERDLVIVGRRICARRSP